MFKPHKYQNLIFIVSGAAILIMIGIYVFESQGIDRIVLLFFLLIAGLLTFLVIGIILIARYVKRKKKLKAWKNNYHNDYYKNLNRRR